MLNDRTKIFLKEVLLGLCLAFGIVILIIIASHLAVFLGSRNGIVSESDAPESLVVMVPGASVLADGTPSGILQDRLDTAIDLYTAGKAKKFLLSGDSGEANYNEVSAMRAYLLSKNILPEDIFLDHAGYDTFDSVYRAKNIYGVTDVLIVSQNFHLPRVVYLGRAVGLAATGVVADKHTYQKIDQFIIREWLADVKAVYDVIVHAKSTYLGEPVSIHGDGRVTWD